MTLELPDDDVLGRRDYQVLVADRNAACANERPRVL